MLNKKLHSHHIINNLKIEFTTQQNHADQNSEHNNVQN